MGQPNSTVLMCFPMRFGSSGDGVYGGFHRFTALADFSTNPATALHLHGCGRRSRELAFAVFRARETGCVCSLGRTWAFAHPSSVPYTVHAGKQGRDAIRRARRAMGPGPTRALCALRVSRRSRREGTAKGLGVSKTCAIAGKENVRGSSS